MIVTAACTPQSRGRRAAQTALRSMPIVALWVAFSAGLACAADPAPGPLVAYRIVGDAIPEALAPGDAARGKALVAARDPANCVLCHAVPDPAIPFAGNVGPPLAGVGSRLTASQLRLRIVDNLSVNPQTVMPSYYRLADLKLVAAPYQGRTILTAPQVEDVVAYLATLR
ncbi:MAG TPA: sulfur oxidation c-type cytochrome SoxX [Casimicrobiaceae bacterium]|nr:sulfur oxidation c-type cytochrome SoxX [Casimicrobiaceae bacterium]